MTDEDPQRPDEPDPPSWLGHPLLAIPFMAVIGLGVVSRFLEGDARLRAMALPAIVVGSVTIATGVALMRGALPPPPGRRGRLISPIATIVVGAAITLAGLTLASELADHNEPSTRTFVLSLGAFALAFLGLVLAALSQSARWPDKWRSPYVRMSPDDDRTSSRPSDTPADDA